MSHETSTVAGDAPRGTRASRASADAPNRIPRRARGVVRGLTRTVVVVAYIAVLLVVWHFGVIIFDTPAFILPPPAEVGSALGELVSSGELFEHIGFTLKNAAIGYLIGATLGVLLGYLLASFRLFSWMMTPYLVVLQAAPKVALAPLLVVWFGLGTATQIGLVVLLAFFPVLIGTASGMARVDPNLTDLARVLDLGRWRYLTRVQLPSALPTMFTFAKLGLLDSLTGAILAELIASEQGLGYLLAFASATYKAPLMIGAIVVVIAIASALYFSLTALARVLMPWQTDA